MSTDKTIRPLVALDMTFPEKPAIRRSGTGVYAHALLAALGKRNDVAVTPISSTRASLSPGLTGTLRWLLRDGARAIERHGAALLHCPAYVTPFRSQRPYVITLHDAAALRFPEEFARDWRWYNRIILPTLARRAARIIVPSAFARRDIAAHYNIPESRIVVTAEAADPRYRPQPTIAVRRIRERLQAGSDAPLLFFSGAPLPRKNLELILCALAKAEPASALARARLVISGATADGFPAVQARIAHLDLADRIQWLGRIPEEELPLVYAAADVLVYPSRYEGFGLPPLEALACGTPVVAAAATSLIEVLGDGALLIDPDDPQACAIAIETLLTRPDVRGKVLEAGKRQLALYTWDRCAAETADIYRAVLQP